MHPSICEFASDFSAEDLVVWRKKLTISQIAAADLLGISSRMYCRYEHGEWPVPRAIILACAALDHMLDTSVRSITGSYNGE